MMGNDPNGVRVYIDTTLFLYPVIGSLSLVLKSVIVVMVELHLSKRSFLAHCSGLLHLQVEPLMPGTDFIEANLPAK